MSGQRERRKAVAAAVALPVEYAGEDFIGKGVVLNASASGVLVRGDYVAVVGTSMGLRIVPNHGEPLSIERAVVRWRRGNAFGVEILLIMPEAHVRLMDLMHSILRGRRCRCTPTLPWLCRCGPAWTP